MGDKKIMSNHFHDNTDLIASDLKEGQYTDLQSWVLHWYKRYSHSPLDFEICVLPTEIYVSHVAFTPMKDVVDLWAKHTLPQPNPSIPLDKYIQYIKELFESLRWSIPALKDKIFVKNEVSHNKTKLKGHPKDVIKVQIEPSEVSWVATNDDDLEQQENIRLAYYGPSDYAVVDGIGPLNKDEGAGDLEFGYDETLDVPK